MRYVIAVKSPIYGKQGAFLAYQFAEALIKKGHEISQIFFFQDGVSNGNALVYPANDEVNLQKHWQVFPLPTMFLYIYVLQHLKDEVLLIT